MKFWPVQAKSGDMVRVRIGSIWHYGVYVDDEEVIQFGMPPRDGAESPEVIRVVSTDMEAFSGGSIVETLVLSGMEKLRRIPPKKTVALARQRIGSGGYDLLHNNCEHFAFECVFGVKRSLQEEEARKRWDEYQRTHPKQ